MTEAYMMLVDQVGAVRQAWRFRRAVETIMLTLGVAAAVLTATSALDQWIAFGHVGRVVQAACVYGAALAAARHASRTLRTAHHDDFFAAMIERRHPASRNRIINALQLGREATWTAPALIEAIIEQGAIAMDDLEAGRVASEPAMRRYTAGLLIAAALLAGYAGVGGPGARVSMARVLMPLASIEAFAWTDVTVTPTGTVHVLEGAALKIEAKVSARAGSAAVSEASVRWTDEVGRMRRAEMTAGPGGAFSYTMPAVDVGLRFVVTAGDATSGQTRVIVDARPRVEKMTATLHHPRYTAMADEHIDNFDGHISALPTTQVDLTLKASKDLEAMGLVFDDGRTIACASSGNARTWSAKMTIQKAGSWHVKLRDGQGYEVDGAVTYTISVLDDAPPVVAITGPGRDVQVTPDAAVSFVVEAQDRYGLGPVALMGRVNDAKEPAAIRTWANDTTEPAKTLRLTMTSDMNGLKLAAGDRLEYWATAADRNDVSPSGPGRATSRVYHLIVLTPEQAAASMSQQTSDYAAAVAELIRQQRLNRAQTAAMNPPAGLINRQNLIRRQTQQLATVMTDNAFPAQTIIAELRDLAADPMAKALSMLEGCRDAANLEAGKHAASDSLPVQDDIITRLNAILVRLDRNEQMREKLKRLEQENPPEAKKVDAKLQQIATDLDKFLTDLKDLDEKYERMPKRPDDKLSAEQLKDLADAEHRLDRWKKWSKDSIDDLAKLPQGFVNDSKLAENISTIFEEIEKKARPATQEIATPAEEGAKALATEVAEDLEMWLPDKGDSTKWAMEDPVEGKFNVPETKLPDKLQDIVGDLIEDLDEFDKEADDKTGAWGGNMQAGWDVADGPISSFAAVGKTGNQLPNDSELSGRSGAGRRGKSSGQMVGAENTALEGRPTPARTTNEPYDQGNVESQKQLDPRGSTGGGKKTGGGERGLQGGTPPDVVKDMERLNELHKIMREKAQQVAKDAQITGREGGRIDRALYLLQSAEQDAHDHRYFDAARKRKEAIGELRAAEAQVDSAVKLSLQKAVDLPADMRQQIDAASQQALPQGYEDIVGAYYKALSEAGSRK
ncbi:MAG: hypothetical protein GC162_03550 [Planctomycetes bacterium]|nr:hypothetical protein [Planctomycetota bacterium]